LFERKYFFKIATELHGLYIDEEQRLQDEWNDMCKLFEQKLIEKNERLLRKFYQLFKEQTMISYDDVNKIYLFFFQQKNKNYFLFRNFTNKFELFFLIQMIIIIIY
jgi:hypothetical protein